MADTPDPAGLLVQNLAWIRRVAASLCRHRGLSGDDADEFASWAILRLIDNDYAIVRKFRGDAVFTTYLTVVLKRLYRDFQVSELGRWRPSAAARRGGDVAVQLERLVRRDGYELAQAGHVLRSMGVTEMSDRELGTLLAASPAGTGGRPKRAGDAPLEGLAATHGADRHVAESEARTHRGRVTDALSEAIEALPAEDRVILQLRFWKKQKIADIARTLGLEQKPLYRRIEKLVAGLRPALEQAGISKDEVREMLDLDHW